MAFDSFTLECFVAIHDTGSFTKAADKVFRTQSAVSQQVTKLEMQVGKKLINRGQNLTLTADGEVLLNFAKKIIQLDREAMDYFRHPELHGEVRFGLPEDFASVFLSDVLSKYASLHPRITVNIECDLTLNLFERFKQKDFDLVLVKMSRPETFPEGLEVWSEPLTWVGSQEFLGSNYPVPLVLSPQPCVYRSRAIKSLENNNRLWRVAFSSESFASKIAAVKAGMGITVLPRNMVPEGLTILRDDLDLPALDDAHVSMLKHDNDNSVVNSFQDFVVKHLRD